MLLLAILEVVLVSWIYGADKIFEHIEEMEIKIPTFMKCYWRVCWKYLTPGNIYYTHYQALYSFEYFSSNYKEMQVAATNMSVGFCTSISKN